MQLLERIGPATKNLMKNGIDFSPWFKPEKYATDFWMRVIDVLEWEKLSTDIITKLMSNKMPKFCHIFSLRMFVNFWFDC